MILQSDHMQTPNSSEIQHREASYQEMQKRLPVDKSKINDQNLMSTLIPLRREERVVFALERPTTAVAASAAVSTTSATTSIVVEPNSAPPSDATSEP
jgi:hypothetical protein